MSSTTALAQPQALDVDQIVVRLDASRIFESIDCGANWVCHFYSPDGTERLATLAFEDLAPNQQALHWPLLIKAKLAHQRRRRHSPKVGVSSTTS